jgi:hypothetical protein
MEPMETTPAQTTSRPMGRRTAVQPPKRPPYADVDLDPSRRPGVPRERRPEPFPNTRFPIERQQGESAAPMHGRPNRHFPPVFGTATPLRGLSGLVRRRAYRLPDHKARHWMMLLLGDRVEVWGYRARRFAPAALPLVGLGLLSRRILR